MIPLRGELLVDTDVLAELSDAARAAPRRFRRRYQQQVSRTGSRLLKVLRSENPRPPDLPFIWSNNPRKQAKARAWYFANKVPPGSTGGRYERTGELQESWTVRADLAPEEGVISLENSAPGAEFVIGRRQAPSHAASGWIPIDERVVQFSEELTNDLINVWFEVVEGER